MSAVSSHAPSESFSRSFGFLAMSACAAGSLYALNRHLSVGWSVAGAIAALGLGGFAVWAPRRLAPLSMAWMKLGLLIGKVVNPLVFGVMFFGLITPVGWVSRLRGRDALRVRLNPAAPTYWVDRQPPGPRPESFKNQF